MKPYIIDQAEQLDSWPRKHMTTRARTWTANVTVVGALAQWRDVAQREEMLREDRLLLEQLVWGCVDPDGQTHDEALSLEAMEVRRELLRTLCQSRLPLEARQRQAFELCVRHIELLSGFRRWLATGPRDFQLATPQAWWRADGEWGSFVDNDAFVQRYISEPETLKRNEFKQIPQQEYRQRALPYILRIWLQLVDDTMLDVAAVIYFYTAMGDSSDHSFELRKLRTRLLQQLPSLDRRHTALPMRPLYSLPRESRNVYKLVLSKAEDLVVTESGALKGKHPWARAKLVGEDQLLLFDTALVLKRSGRGDAYMSVELESPEQDVLRALFAATEQLGLKVALLEHLPRIVMGCFTAAHRDRKLFQGATHEGAFWDTESGRRLCQLIGFDPENQRHRLRVQQIRELLCRLKLHREVISSEGKRVRTSVNWEGPLIQPLQDKLELRREDQEGMVEQQVFQSWLIARELWNMTQPSSRVGGAPAFMLIDQRAFHMDPTSSVPFNLYWTLVNRAYIERRTESADAPFQIALRLWCDWAGVDFERPATLKRQLVTALELMVRHELLLSWRCEPLEQDRPATLHTLDAHPLEVIFHPTQAQFFLSKEG